jgi:outer membrane protein TolC
MKARVEKEMAEYEHLSHTKAKAELNIPIQVIKSYQDVRQWKVAVEAYQTAAVASRKWIVASLTSFDMGTGTADDLLRGIERYGQNRGRYLEALFNYNMSLAQLDYAMGVRSW